MFKELGMKLDNLIQGILTWNTQRIWYKPYAYLKIKKWIKNNRFEGKRHFEKLINVAIDNKLIWDWQYVKLLRKYREKESKKSDYEKICEAIKKDITLRHGRL